MRLQFYLRFHTEFGQSIWITGDCEELGNNDPANAMPMEYLNEEFWQYETTIKKKDLGKKVSYKYFLKNSDGELIYEWGNDRQIELPKKLPDEIQLTDTWNHVDMDGPLLLEEDLATGITYDFGKIGLSNEPGLGINYIGLFTKPAV